MGEICGRYECTFVKNVEFLDDSAQLSSLIRQQLRNLAMPTWSSLKQYANATLVFPGLKFAAQSIELLVAWAQSVLFL